MAQTGGKNHFFFGDFCDFWLVDDYLGLSESMN